jgi:hypothetical protein
MSYTRDPDHYTRGVGAVQAVDKVKSARRARLELERRRALARTDAKKVGLMGLGAINTSLSPKSQYQFGRQTATTTFEGGSTVLSNPGPLQAPQPGGRGGPVTTVPQTPISAAAAALRGGGTRLIAPPPGGGRTAPPGMNVGPGPNVLVPPDVTQTKPGTSSGGVMVDPGPDQTGGSVGGAAGGGAGSGGVSVGPSSSTPDPGDTTAAPNLDLESASGSISAFVSANKTALLIAAALGIGLYAYSKRKKRAP